MIKLLALITMVIDHCGITLFPDTEWLRFIGRLSMPLFGYSVARGFSFAKEHGTIIKYFRNLICFTLVSEIPYCLLEKEIGLNIGFTWLLAVLVLHILEGKGGKVERYLLSAAVLIGGYLLSIFAHYDYGIYGVMTAICMYYLMVKKNDTSRMFLASVVLWAFYVVVLRRSFIQFFAIFAPIVITILKPYDNRIRLPKRLYYWFYPLHILALVFIERMNVI